MVFGEETVSGCGIPVALPAGAGFVFATGKTPQDLPASKNGD